MPRWLAIPALFSIIAASPATAATNARESVTILETRFEKGEWLPAGGDWIGFVAGGRKGENGAYGIELRGGDNGKRGTWEIGVGDTTSQKNFSQGEWDWGCGANNADGCGVEAHFALEWLPDGLVFSLDNGKRATVIKAPPGARLSGNTLKIVARGDANLTLFAIDGVEMTPVLRGGGNAKASDTLFLYSPLQWARDGLVAKGTVRMKGGGNSARGISFSEGNYVPSGAVPEPEAWSLMIIGFGVVGAAMRRQRYLLTL